MSGRKLNEMMSLDHVIIVMENGVVMDHLGSVYAPTLYEGELDSSDWEFFSTGYTGQYGYRGPIMHNSEYIGGRLEEDILSTPGVYAAIVAEWKPDPEDSDENYVEGWAVVKLKD